MNNGDYQAYLTKQSYEELMFIRGSLNKIAYPERYALVVAEIDNRDTVTAPSPCPGMNNDLSGRSDARPTEVSPLTKTLILGGFILQVVAAFMRYADAEALQTARPIVALLGAAFGVVGCVKFARTIGRSRWWGLCGLLGILGIGVLCALREKAGSPPLPKTT